MEGSTVTRRPVWTRGEPPPGAAEAALALAGELVHDLEKALEAADYAWESIDWFWDDLGVRYGVLGCGGTRCAVVVPGGWYVVKLPINSYGMDANTEEGTRYQNA